MTFGVYRAVMMMPPTNTAEAWEAPRLYTPMDVACLAFLVLWKCGRLDAELGGG